MRRTLIACLFALVGLGTVEARAADPLAQWGQWRGPLGTGEAPAAKPPLRWSETENIRWKRAIPGRGLSTPVVWGDRLFLTTAEAYGPQSTEPFHDAHGAHDNVAPLQKMRFMVIAVDRRSGELLWQKKVRDQRPHEGAHVTGGWASNSAVTDGEVVVAFFGSRGLFAFDVRGKVLWEKDLGDMQSRHGHGEGASPALYGNTLVVNWDHQGDSFVVALDKRSGKELWRRSRDEITSWSTPHVVEVGGKPQVVISATGAIRSYDLKTGKTVWEAPGLSRNVVASPVSADGYLYAGSSYGEQVMRAIRLDGAKGNLAGSEHIAWSLDRFTPYVPSPVLAGGQLCFLRHLQGYLTCLHAQSGTPLFGPEKLRRVRRVFASPIVADGRLYIVGQSGRTLVLRNGPTLEVLATNELDDGFSASPVAVGDALYLRGESALYCIAEAPQGKRR